MNLAPCHTENEIPQQTALVIGLAIVALLLLSLLPPDRPEPQQSRQPYQKMVEPYSVVEVSGSHG